MKKVVILIVLAVIVTACDQSKTTNESTEVNLVEKYMAVKDALVSTDPAKAKAAAADFLKVSNNVSLKTSLETIANSNDVAIQRKAFEDLSMNMYSFVKSSGTKTVLYKQYCPMAFDNKGAYWLASEEEVNNPYFGDVMLHCGSVQEVLNN